jgi:hypothetical protein
MLTSRQADVVEPAYGVAGVAGTTLGDRSARERGERGKRKGSERISRAELELHECRFWVDERYELSGQLNERGERRENVERKEQAGTL